MTIAELAMTVERCSVASRQDLNGAVYEMQIQPREE